MIAPSTLPEPFKRWNTHWSAPNGRDIQWPEWLKNSTLGIRRRGPFAWQPNNGTREFEYPWAYRAISERGRNLNIVEIGGGVSGLQFVLARDGHRVTNIDPGQADVESDWQYDQQRHGRLCKAFGAPVNLIPATLGTANIPDASTDVLLCVSALEHFPDDAVAEFCRHAARILKPEGVGVLSVDLFLDVRPFCPQTSNRFGKNIDLYRLLCEASLELVSGNRHELHGFPEFDPAAVKANLSAYLQGVHPALAQCFIVKRAPPSRSKDRPIP